MPIVVNAHHLQWSLSRPLPLSLLQLSNMRMALPWRVIYKATPLFPSHILTQLLTGACLRQALTKAGASNSVLMHLVTNAARSRVFFIEHIVRKQAPTTLVNVLKAWAGCGTWRFRRHGCGWRLRTRRRWQV